MWGEGGWCGPKGGKGVLCAISANVVMLGVNGEYSVHAGLEVGMLEVHASEHVAPPGENVDTGVQVSTMPKSGEGDGGTCS